MGMLRTLLVVGAAFALMPSPPTDPNGASAAAGPGSFAYMAAAAETVADMRSFCQRNPNVCVTAVAVAQSVEGKAKYSAKLIYEWANDRDDQDTPQKLSGKIAPADPLQTSSLPAKHVDLKESQNTLTLADLVPEWRRPKTRPQG
jgi:Family of unknown function (DUF5330)